MMESDTAVGSSVDVTCAKDDLVAALGVVSRAVSTRGSVQVLGGVRLQAGPGTRRARRDGHGALAADEHPGERAGRRRARRAREAAGRPGAAPAGGRGDDLAIGRRTAPRRSARARTPSRVNVFAAEDFPRLPAVDVPLQRDRRAGAARDHRPRVARSASRDESRPVLTGILVHFEGDTLVMAATDSYRLSVKETSARRTGPELEAIIPARALGELARIAAGAEDVQLGVNENHVVFGVGDAWLTTRRIDGQFPNVKQLLPESFERGARPAPRRAARDRPSRGRDGAAQHAAAAPVRRGRAARSRRRARTSARRASRCRSPTPASRSRSASTRSSSARASSRSPTTPCG